MHSRYEVRGHVTPPGRPTQHTVIFEVTGTPEIAGERARRVYETAVYDMRAGATHWDEVVLEGPNGLFHRAGRDDARSHA